MYTRARGVEVGKWPARRARRPPDLERYRSAVATDNTNRRPPGSATKTLLCLPIESPREPVENDTLAARFAEQTPLTQKVQPSCRTH